MAIGVGVFLGLLIVIIAIAGFAFYYLRLRKVTHSRFKDSVSFENPGYATMAEAQVVVHFPYSWHILMLHLLLPNSVLHVLQTHPDSSVFIYRCLEYPVNRGSTSEPSSQPMVDRRPQGIVVS